MSILEYNEEEEIKRSGQVRGVEATMMAGMQETKREGLKEKQQER